MTNSQEGSPKPARARRKRSGFFAGTVAFGVDLGRLESALALQVRPVGPRRFEVFGGAEPHFVDLSREAACPCDCGDFTWRGGTHPSPCKHMLRALLAEGDARILLAVAALVAGMREYAEGLERRLRPRPIRLSERVKADVAKRVRHPVSALTFTRQETGADARVLVTLGTTGILLGQLVRDENGVAFVSDESDSAQVRAA